MQMVGALVSLLVCSVAATHSVEKPKNHTAVPIQQNATVPELTKKLEHVVSGLDAIYEKQSKTADGPTKFALILKPFLSEVRTVLQDVKTSKKLTEGQKMVKLQNAQASIKGLTKDMFKLTKGLQTDKDESDESLLMGVLMSRKDSEAKQLEVMNSAEFKHLEVVKYVLAHRDSKKNIVEQVATYLDQKGGSKPAGNKTAKPVSLATRQAMSAQIVGALEGQLKKMQKHLGDQVALHKKIDTELEESVKKDEVKTSHLKGTDKEQKRKTARSMKMAKRMQKKEDRQYVKQHALEEHDANTLKTAIDAVKKGDMKALETAKKALEHSFQAMQSGTGDFLHFLQLSTWTFRDSRTQACPYCKAQCLEKCHSNGSSFVTCMTECDKVGN